MGKRLLAYVRPHGMAARLNTAALGDTWDIYATDDPLHASALLEEGRFRVGLVALEGWVDPVDAVETLLRARKQVRWVGLADPGTLAGDELRTLIYQGFYDFHTLPADTARLHLTLGHAYGMATLNGCDSGEPHAFEHRMIGSSSIMHQIGRILHKCAVVDAPVLIQGESGTGKELAALAIHEHSSRRRGPFVAVNCGALPGSLIQSELFGHERGAFTGAHQRRAGKIESAAGGTILLDEIGDLPLDLQVNLLRFLQHRCIERVGGTTPVPVDVRVLAASHIDLEDAVAKGRFREDLFYRLNVLRVRVPPLRERGSDVSELAHYFFNQFRNEHHPHLRGFSRSALQAMRAHAWPGNIRELINRVRQAVIMCEDSLIMPSDLGLSDRADPAARLTLDMARDLATRAAVEVTLQRAGNNISEAARQLDVSRVTLYRLLEKYNLRA